MDGLSHYNTLRYSDQVLGGEKMQLKFNKNGRLVTISTPSGVGIVYAPTKAEMRKKVTAMVAHMIEREIGKNETYFIS